MKEQLGHLDLPFFSQLSPDGLKSGDVIEFCGTEGTGKSEILLNIVIRCVLPKTFDGRNLGKETDIVYISTDHKFDIQRLTGLLENQISQCVSLDDPQHKELVLSSLARVHVVHCNTSSELTLSLQYLKSFLHHQSNVSGLVLDNVASYYWMDRDKSESHWITSLKQLIQDYHLSVFASKPLLFHKTARTKVRRLRTLYWNIIIYNRLFFFRLRSRLVMISCQSCGKGW